MVSILTELNVSSDSPVVLSLLRAAHLGSASSRWLIWSLHIAGSSGIFFFQEAAQFVFSSRHPFRSEPPLVCPRMHFSRPYSLYILEEGGAWWNWSVSEIDFLKSLNGLIPDLMKFFCWVENTPTFRTFCVLGASFQDGRISVGIYKTLWNSITDVENIPQNNLQVDSKCEKLTLLIMWFGKSRIKPQ